MFLPFSSLRRRRGFTLLELLVVIAIIAILAAVMFPAFTAMQTSARKTQALADERSIVVATFNYRGEYGKLPLTQGQLTGAVAPYNSDTVYGDPGDKALYHGYWLMDILRAKTDDQNKNNVLNPSQTVYIDPPMVKNPKDPHSGILPLPHQERPDYTMQPGSYVDPWGSEYVVWFDANKDGDLNTATKWFYPKYADPDGPKGTVQVGSMGKDGEFGLNGQIAGSDDVITTQ